MPPAVTTTPPADAWVGLSLGITFAAHAAGMTAAEDSRAAQVNANRAAAACPAAVRG
jgi:hypothetical protein